ncbi:hypothetical protein ACXR6G_01135 [Ancylomarina sp. YFZ004]
MTTLQTNGDFYAYLFAKFMDGNIKTKDGDKQNPTMKQPGYSDKWKKAVVKDTGDQLKVKGASH